MSHDICMHTSNLSDHFEEMANPFTGEVTKQPVGESITEDERQALLALLERSKADGPDEIGGYIVRVADNEEIELSLFGIDEPGGFRSGYVALRSLSKSIAGLLYEMAIDANLVIQLGSDGGYVCLERKIADRVAHRWSEVQVIGSAEELYQLLVPGFEAWVEFKDRAVGSFDPDAFSFDSKIKED